MEKYENNLGDQRDSGMESNIDIDESKEEQEMSPEEIAQIIEQTKDAYRQAVDAMFEDDDPLKQKILDYFVNREDVNNEYEFILAKLSDTEKEAYPDTIRESLKNAPLFINKMERYFTTQDVYANEKEMKIHPRPATEQEYELGAYAEFLEPQVRDAVFTMSEKGYKTFQSGFKENNPTEQFMDVYNKHIKIPDSLEDQMSAAGVRVVVENFDDRTTVTLTPENPDQVIRQEKWKEIWDQFTASLPDADPELVENMSVPNLHDDFRKTQDILKKIENS